MMNCCVCQSNSGRREICYTCAVSLWPHRIVNPGAKKLARTIMAAPDPTPLRHLHGVSR
jgi:hypothetical protein